MLSTHLKNWIHLPIHISISYFVYFRNFSSLHYVWYQWPTIIINRKVAVLQCTDTFSWVNIVIKTGAFLRHHEKLNYQRSFSTMRAYSLKGIFWSEKFPLIYILTLINAKTFNYHESCQCDIFVPSQRLYTAR